MGRTGGRGSLWVGQAMPPCSSSYKKLCPPVLPHEEKQEHMTANEVGQGDVTTYEVGLGVVAPNELGQGSL